MAKSNTVKSASASASALASALALANSATLASLANNEKAILPAGKKEITFGNVVVSGSTTGELTANMLVLQASIERLGYPALCAIAVINGLKNTLKIKSQAVCIALGRPQYEGKPIDYSTPQGIGRRVSRLTAYITGLKAIANPFLLLEHVTDYQIGAELIARALDEQGVVFDTLSSTFVDDKESEAFKARTESEKAAKDAITDTETETETETDAPLEEALLETVTQAESVIDEVIGLLAGRYVMTSEKALNFKELKAVTADNDKAISELIAMLAAKKAA